MHHAEDAQTDRKDAMSVVQAISDSRKKERLKRRKRMTMPCSITSAHTDHSQSRRLQQRKNNDDKKNKGKRKRKQILLP